MRDRSTRARARRRRARNRGRAAGHHARPSPSRTPGRFLPTSRTPAR
ncbi:hypothetical protein HQ346_07025 [Rhodococcus sp. BP-252]|nr:hypothetical protein [Rhodococcus sp. BP-320]MBY6416698.1 hypothetical protein [Rhodococcus sp. BP-321]MBY6421113.1 hypothetical protein [Rhodococcus sp. BP-324]MBY6426722.1 hypothetical protein [Rhodococcus sp. BP-323]MBY6431721.1 hypothetical protein [Rhodococcus sp. BP-322]MBY6440662.1 hypothetical protein [Rhodococcus sp. BP-319]MBY6445820.1 hypothetical protein [Rhodococcus sp. BP-318]MBY6450635.1 hypothetical protein [Rhodococcus sp. BP-315]MBY6455400.1 hypothetical protein [Rhodoc